MGVVIAGGRCSYIIIVGRIYGCGYQKVGVVSRCCCKEVYIIIDFLLLFIPTPLACISSIPILLCSFFKINVFSFLLTLGAHAHSEVVVCVCVCV